VAQCEHGLQLGEVAGGEIGDIGEIFRPAQRRREGDEQHLGQVVPGVLGARISHLAENRQHCIHRIRLLEDEKPLRIQTTLVRNRGLTHMRFPCPPGEAGREAAGRGDRPSRTRGYGIPTFDSQHKLTATKTRMAAIL
jgi:hypothetical protein